MSADSIFLFLFFVTKPHEYISRVIIACDTNAWLIINKNTHNIFCIINLHIFYILRVPRPGWGLEAQAAPW